MRLIAASDVVLAHYMGHTPNQHHHWLIFLTGFFPGVPIFFFISGFVISGAWLRRPQVRDYAAARITRIFPPLFLPLIVGLAGLYFLYDSDLFARRPLEMALWIASQILLPGWNPDFLRDYGVGVVNGSLWTIPVELSFYVMAPLFLILGLRSRRTTLVLAIAVIVSLAINTFAHYGLGSSDRGEVGLQKILLISPLSSISWFWMFATGVLAQHWFARLREPLVRRCWWIVAAWMLVTALSVWIEIPGLLRPWGNNMGLINLIVGGAAMLAVAYRFPDGARRLLRGNDISYGLYILHMPVLNLFLAAGWEGDGCIAAAFASTVLLAMLSWFAIERPLMRRLRARRVTPRHPSVLPVPELS